jgi:hypothetical protein
MLRNSSVIAVAAAVATLVAPTASARTFSGAIAMTGIGTPATTYASVAATAKVTITLTCDPDYRSPTYEYCGYWPMVTTVPASQPCAPTVSGSTWVGPVYAHDQAPGTKSLAANWTEWPSIQSGAKRACVYASGGIGGVVLVAETAYEVPAAPPPPPPPAPPTAVVDYDCADFAYQEDAQQRLLPGDPYRLDGDGDGLACEELPSRQAVTPTLGLGEATTAARSHLRSRYVSYRRGAGRRVSCSRASSYSASCRVSWRYRGSRYSGGVQVRVADADTLSIRSSVRNTSRGWAAAAQLTRLVLVAR